MNNTENKSGGLNSERVHSNHRNAFKEFSKLASTFKSKSKSKSKSRKIIETKKNLTKKSSRYLDHTRGGNVSMLF